MNFARSHPQGGARDIHEFLHGHIHFAGREAIGQGTFAGDFSGPFLLLAHGRARHINGNISAADHNHLLSDGETVAQVHVQKKINALHDAVQVISWQIQLAAAVKAESEEYRLESLSAQVSQREVSSETRIQSKFGSEIENFSNLRL